MKTVRPVTIAAAGSVAMATVLAIGARHREWVARHRFRIQWYVSLPMMLALGYLVACVRHGIFDTVAFACMGVIALGAILKVGLSDSAQMYGNRGHE